MTLAVVSLPYYRHILPYGLEKFKLFAVNVWEVDPSGKTDEQVANEGLTRMDAWMQELDLVLNISELGATEDMLDGLVDATLIMNGGYKMISREEILAIFKESL